MRPEIPPPVCLQGRPGAPGVARGGVLVYDQALPTGAPRKIEADQIDLELRRLKAALGATETEILQARERVSEELGEDHARIFDAHRFILLDDMLVEQAREIIRGGWGAETAYAEACQRIFRSFQSLESSLPDRGGDLRDVERRVLAQLLGRQAGGFRNLTEPVVVVARDINPSDTATMSRDKVLGFITERGGETSHSVILGRSLGIPVVVGVEGLVDQVQNGDQILLDGHTGQLVLHPDSQAETRFERLGEAYAELERQSLRYKDFPAETRDGRQIELLANIELPEEVPAVQEYGGAGVGLFRTEYLFLTRSEFPDEETQYEVYREVLQGLAPDPVIIRSMDLGGEKVTPAMNFPQEDNPSLGWRGIRYALGREEIFRTQLRAILRAGVHGNLRLMVPMVSQVEEIREVKRILAELREELDADGLPQAESYELGIMVETPSAVAIAHLLAKEVDFFSIGTNDLIQYSLAIDRDNRYVQHLYQPFHPAILRQIKRTVKAGKDGGCWVGICGELPENPIFTILLIGLGLDEISVNAYRVPELKRIIRQITYDQAKNLVKSAWSYATAGEIEANVTRLAIRKFPDLAEQLRGPGGLR
jgi:phosphoenolpyruvate-protein phosphotransferase (PTS system enzyme I)